MPDATAGAALIYADDLAAVEQQHQAEGVLVPSRWLGMLVSISDNLGLDCKREPSKDAGHGKNRRGHSSLRLQRRVNRLHTSAFRGRPRAGCDERSTAAERTCCGRTALGTRAFHRC